MQNMTEKRRAQRHELRNALNALLAAAEVIKVLPPHDERVQQACAVIERQARVLALLVDDVLREEGSPPLNEEWKSVAPASTKPKFMRGLLLLETEPTRHAHLSAALRERGHTLTHAPASPAGLALVLQQCPDAVLIDVDAPLRDGLELARQTRAAGYAGKLIACPGPQTALDNLDAMRHGFDELLPYGADVEQVRALLKTRD